VSSGTAAGLIELRLRTLAQLFHTLDPSPFREQDLSAEAEEYIAGCASELPSDAALRIVIHLPPAECEAARATGLGTVVQGYFSGREQHERQARRALFRDGRIALVIGLAILSTCLVLSWRLEAALREAAFGKVIEEGLVIVGWVAIWRPAEIFLYDWLPIERRRRLMGRLARADVTLAPDDGPAAPQTGGGPE
jgi:hypothetical protein